MTKQRCTKIHPIKLELPADHPAVLAGYRQAGDTARVCGSCGRLLIASLSRGRLAHVKALEEK